MAETNPNVLQERLLTSEDLQWFFGCSAECITDGIREGRLPQPTVFNRKYYWTVESIHAHFQQRQAQAEQEATTSRQRVRRLGV